MIRLPIQLITTYFIIGGVVYIYKTFNTSTHEYRKWLLQADFAVTCDGSVIKNRESMNLRVITDEIQKVVRYGLKTYDATYPQLYFVELSEEDFINQTPEQFKTIRQISSSARALLKR